VIGTVAVGWWAVNIWYSEEGHGWAAAPPSPLLAVPRPLYQLRIIRCGAVFAFAL